MSSELISLICVFVFFLGYASYKFYVIGKEYDRRKRIDERKFQREKESKKNEIS